MRKIIEVFSSKTGTGTSSEVKRNKILKGLESRPVMAKVTLTYGTTITIKLEGRRTMISTWETLTEQTFTSGSPRYIKQTSKHPERYSVYRLNITANTGCTVDKGYIGIGRIET